MHIVYPFVIVAVCTEIRLHFLRCISASLLVRNTNALGYNVPMSLNSKNAGTNAALSPHTPCTSNHAPLVFSYVGSTLSERIGMTGWYNATASVICDSVQQPIISCSMLTALSYICSVVSSSASNLAILLSCDTGNTTASWYANSAPPTIDIDALRLHIACLSRIYAIAFRNCALACEILSGTHSNSRTASAISRL